MSQMLWLIVEEDIFTGHKREFWHWSACAQEAYRMSQSDKSKVYRVYELTHQATFPNSPSQTQVLE